MGDFTNGECRVEAAITLGDDHTFKRLQTLTGALFNAYLYDHGIAGRELWDLFFHLFGFKLFDNVTHGLSLLISPGFGPCANKFI